MGCDDWARSLRMIMVDSSDDLLLGAVAIHAPRRIRLDMFNYESTRKRSLGKYK